mmetsp:Transcript_215/g.543  ORF Transcript_215/g.543 Transcript_215/m.543 type:complete len:83 (-) Transcript_215:174-422(-)
MPAWSGQQPSACLTLYGQQVFSEQHVPRGIAQEVAFLSSNQIDSTPLCWIVQPLSEPQPPQRLCYWPLLIGAAQLVGESAQR